MKKAYRVPRGLFPTDMPFASQVTTANEPITQIMVNSLVTNLPDGARVPAAGVRHRGYRLGWRPRHSHRRGLDRPRRNLACGEPGE